MSQSDDLILRTLAAGPANFWDLVAVQDTQHRLFTLALRDLLENALVQTDARGVCRLTAQGWQEARKRGLADWCDSTCPACEGRGVVVEGDLARLRSEFVRLTVHRPEITTEFDQGVVPPGVALARVALLDQRGDLSGRSLLLMGDDDLMSVAFKLHNKARRILVLEIDPRITAFLRQIVEREGWQGIEVYDYDVRDELPMAFHDRFDVFFTDPVESARGIGLFLSRCSQALRSGGRGYFGLTHIESGWPKWLAIQRDISEMNFVVAEVLKDFSQYMFLGEEVLTSQMKVIAEAPVPLPPPCRPWFSSSLFRLQAVGKPKAKIVGSVRWGRELYEDEDTI